MSIPPTYVRRYLTNREGRYSAPGESAQERWHDGVRALITIAHQQARDTTQDRHLSDLIRGLLDRRPDLAHTGRRP